MSTTAERRKQGGASPRQHTIGAVCRHLQAEFPDISISKIRYLEDQGLLAPRRTRGGYRLFSEEDVERLETILRLQRDEFLPLRVIRQELSALSGWPTIPQVFVKGELVGGADIVEELEQTGELGRTLEEKLGPDYRAARDEKTLSVV